MAYENGFMIYFSKMRVKNGRLNLKPTVFCLILVKNSQIKGQIRIDHFFTDQFRAPIKITNNSYTYQLWVHLIFDLSCLSIGSH